MGFRRSEVRILSPRLLLRLLSRTAAVSRRRVE
jgi:hypothetical protein